MRDVGFWLLQRVCPECPCSDLPHDLSSDCGWPPLRTVFLSVHVPLPAVPPVSSFKRQRPRSSHSVLMAFDSNGRIILWHGAKPRFFPPTSNMVLTNFSFLVYHSSEESGSPSNFLVDSLDRGTSPHMLLRLPGCLARLPKLFDDLKDFPLWSERSRSPLYRLAAQNQVAPEAILELTDRRAT